MSPSHPPRHRDSLASIDIELDEDDDEIEYDVDLSPLADPADG